MIPNLGVSRCSQTKVPRSLHHQLGWPGFLGVVVQEHLETQGWEPLLSGYAFFPARPGDAEDFTWDLLDVNMYDFMTFMMFTLD